MSIVFPNRMLTRWSWVTSPSLAKTVVCTHLNRWVGMHVCGWVVGGCGWVCNEII